MNKLNKFLNQLKNASLINKDSIRVLNNPFIEKILKVLYKEGLIQSFYIDIYLNQSYLVIYLRYFYNFSVLTNFKMISKASKLNYLKINDILKIYSKKKLIIFSTSKGVLTDLECKKILTGGIPLFTC
jgi:small subunit ribosomal protein S8